MNPGLYIQFESQPDVAMRLEGLEARASGIELVAVTYHQTDERNLAIERPTSKISPCLKVIFGFISPF